jgi:hypothetical protein
VKGFCERANESSDSMNCEEFLEYISKYLPLKKDNDPWGLSLRRQTNVFGIVPSIHVTCHAVVPSFSLVSVRTAHVTCHGEVPSFSLVSVRTAHVTCLCHMSWRSTELQLGICPHGSSRSTRNLELALNAPSPTAILHPEAQSHAVEHLNPNYTA